VVAKSAQLTAKDTPEKPQHPKVFAGFHRESAFLLQPQSGNRQAEGIEKTLLRNRLEKVIDRIRRIGL